MGILLNEGMVLRSGHAGTMWIWPSAVAFPWQKSELKGKYSAQE
jgi:hypothetical protein